jgi:two-component SAPR family response regulator
VHRLRRLLPEDAILWSERKISLDARRAWDDVWALERELGRLDQGAPSSAPEQRLPLARRVLSLCRGPFLSGNAAAWALAARERLRNKTLRIVGSAADSIGRHEPAAAVPIYEKAIEIDLLRESLYQGLLRCHRQLQQPAEGLRAYRRCHDMLSREMGLAPSPATEALHQALKTGP